MGGRGGRGGEPVDGRVIEVVKGGLIIDLGVRGFLPASAALAVVAGAALRPRRVVVEGPSMEPTLATGDRLVAARGRAARVGDVVAVRRPGGDRRLMVKRVVAVRGDKVVVAGDNPARSTDSRSFGPVRRREILGRVVYRYAPEGRTGRVR